VKCPASKPQKPRYLELRTKKVLKVWQAKKTGKKGSINPTRRFITVLFTNRKKGCCRRHFFRQPFSKKGCWASKKKTGKKGFIKQNTQKRN
jgi:hypothetical protein